MAKLVSKTYGDALFELALEEDLVEQLAEECAGVKQVLEENADLSKVMEHPRISVEEKLDLLDQVFSGRICDQLLGLMRLVAQKDHFKEMGEVLSCFLEQVKEYKHIGTAYVTSAAALSPAQQQAVEKRLLETTPYVEFEMHYDLDPTLIGGLRIRIGDRVVDSSVKNKLDRLTRELRQIQVKAGECTP